MAKRTALAIALLLATAPFGLSACDTGKPTPANISRLQTGVTTYDQAVALLGKPYHLDSRGGRLLAMWVSVAPNGTRSGVIIGFNEKGVAEVIQ